MWSKTETPTGKGGLPEVEYGCKEHCLKIDMAGNIKT